MSDNWLEHSQLVLEGLKRLETQGETTRRDIGKLREEMAALKVKAGVWGAIAGAIPALLALAYGIIKAL